MEEMTAHACRGWQNFVQTFLYRISGAPVRAGRRVSSEVKKNGADVRRKKMEMEMKMKKKKKQGAI